MRLPEELIFWPSSCRKAHSSRRSRRAASTTSIRQRMSIEGSHSNDVSNPPPGKIINWGVLTEIVHPPDGSTSPVPYDSFVTADARDGRKDRPGRRPRGHPIRGLRSRRRKHRLGQQQWPTAACVRLRRSPQSRKHERPTTTLGAQERDRSTSQFPYPPDEIPPGNRRRTHQPNSRST